MSEDGTMSEDGLMSEDGIEMESIEIRRAPGFASGGFSVEDLSPGVNVIHGPNGAGKTTLARSIQGLLWPRSSDERCSILGHFGVGEDSWRVDLASKRARYQRNETETNGPSLPSPDQRTRYHLSLHDLLQHETRNESFAQRIQQESIGGYDLDAAHEALGFTGSPSTRGIGEHSTATNAREAWHEAKRNAEELKGDEARLPTLESRLADAKAARDRVELYEQAIEYRRAQTALEEAQTTFEDFPAELDEVSGNEAETVRKLNERIEKEEDRIADAKSALREAKGKLDDADLPPEGLPEGFIERLEERRDSFQSLEARKDQLNGELQKAETRRREAHEDIPLQIDQETLEDFDPAAWPEIEAFAKRAERVSADRKAYDAIQSWLGEDGSERVEHDIKPLLRGSQALEEWLAASADSGGSDGRPALRIAAVSAALLATAGIALGVLVHPLLFGTLVVALGVLWYGYRTTSDAAQGHSESRRPHRETFEHLDVEEPNSWTREDVRSRLTEIYDLIAEASVEQERRERRDALTVDLDDLSEREEALADQRERLIEQYGVVPDTTDIELVAITRRVLDWQETNAKVEGRAAEIGEITDSADTKCERIEADLDPYGYESVGDHAEATQHIRDLDRRQQNHREATTAVDTAESTIEDANAEIERLTGERDAIYAALDLEEGALDALTELCEQVEDYDDAKSDVGRKREVVDKETADLKKHPAFETVHLDWSAAELRESKQEAAETADDCDELREKITKIETRIEDAKRDYDLEAAVEERQRALDALEDRLETDAAAMVGDAIVDHLRETTEENGRPAVFEHAREVLAKITRGRYELDIDGDAFRAYDTVEDRGFDLDELSSGTRLQLLLAVRIAFVQRQEQGVKLPLLLDETLANSDDRRADVIVQSLIELARDGRQVFYFTAQGDEVVKWQRALRDSAGVDHRTIDLAAVRSTDDSIGVPALDDLDGTGRSLQNPADHDHESYGEIIDVPPFSPQKGAGSVHVWYVVDDAELVHYLLRIGIDSWGQLETLVERTDESVITEDEEMLERICRTGEALAEFIKCWEVGRGKRVDRLALEETSAVSDNFIDEVYELAESVDGDAANVLQRLRAGHVNRFRRDKTDQLERFFEDHGYIQKRDPLDSGTIRARVVSRLTRTGLSDDEAFDEAESLFERLVAHSEAQNVR